MYKDNELYIPEADDVNEQVASDNNTTSHNTEHGILARQASGKDTVRLLVLTSEVLTRKGVQENTVIVKV